MVYLGVHDSRATAWATYGPHVSTKSGQRVPLALAPQPQIVEPVEMPSYEEPEPVPYVEPSLFAAPMRVREESAVAVATYAPAYAAVEFTHSDALLGELMTELAMLRDELSYLRDRVDSLTTTA